MFAKPMLIILAGALAISIAIAAYFFAPFSPAPLQFSPVQVLGATWYGYKNIYLEPETFRTIDHQRDGITTSEGQSYTMLRAVWMGDKESFDGAWRWTKENLGRTSDELFAWLWGLKSDGTYGVLNESGGQNSASDADTDIALALLFAYARWQDPMYLEEAELIIDDIWNEEVIMINGSPYLAANNIEEEAGGEWIVVNPSYFSPAAYHLFTKVDAEHDWEALRENSYVVLERSSEDALDSSRSANLPPDWIEINRETGEIRASTSQFGFDALRVPFRIALDAQWFDNPRASAYLEKLSFLSDEWEKNRVLRSTYGHDGTVLSDSEAVAFYGGTLGYFMNFDPAAGGDIYKKKLLALYDTGRAGWHPALSYYDDNWAWFGIALYNGLLPDLTKDLPETAFRQSS